MQIYSRTRLLLLDKNVGLECGCCVCVCSCVHILYSFFKCKHKIWIEYGIIIESSVHENERRGCWLAYEHRSARRSHDNLKGDNAINYAYIWLNMKIFHWHRSYYMEHYNKEFLDILWPLNQLAQFQFEFLSRNFWIYSLQNKFIINKLFLTLNLILDINLKFIKARAKDSLPLVR